MAEGFFRIPVGDSEVELSRDNTSIYRHLGAAAVFDHLFISIDNKGAYIWNTHSQYEEIGALAVQNLCTTHLNLQEPAEVDIKNYLAHHTEDIADEELGVPEEWQSGGTN